MTHIIKKLIYTTLFGDPVPLPQFTRKSDGEQVEALGEKAPFVQIIDANGHPIDQNKPMPVRAQGNYFGYSTDAKPSGAIKGDSFLELDTKEVYVFDGDKWVVF